MEVIGRVLVFCVLNAILSEAAFRFEDCSSGDSIINISQFNVLPDPVDMKKNMVISLQGEVLREIPQSAELEVRYYRTREVFGIQFNMMIPCILGKYGSCTLPLCDYMDRFRTQICPFLANTTDCECPPRAGTYRRNDVDVEMAETSAIRRFIAKGKYRSEIRLKDGETKDELACFKFYTELT